MDLLVLLSSLNGNGYIKPKQFVQRLQSAWLTRALSPRLYHWLFEYIEALLLGWVVRAD